MHLLAERRVLIENTADNVFNFAADLNNFKEWFPGVVAIKSGDARAFTVAGKVYTETLNLPFGRRRSVDIRVRECRRNEFIATEGNLRPLYPRMEMEFRRVDNQIAFTWRMYSRARGTFTRWLLIPAARRIMNRRARLGMARLKALLEERRRASRAAS